MYQRYKKFITYIATSLSSSIVDLILFEIVFLWLDQHGEGKAIVIATLISRIVSSIVSYILNRRFVFHSHGKRENEIYKFVTLICIKMFLSAAIVAWLNSILQVSELVIKCVIDGILFMAFYILDKNWVYKERDIK